MVEANKNELMIIQNELLGDIKNVELRLNEKYKIVIQSFEEHKMIFDKKINVLEKAYNSLVQRLEPKENNDNSKEKEINSKITLLNKRLEENCGRLELKLNILEENLKDTTYKYDRAIADNFIIPGLVGPKAPFSSLRELIEITYKKSLDSLKLKQQQSIDLKNYKEKMDSSINNSRNELSKLEVKINANFGTQMKDLENKFQQGNNIIEERINTMRMDNAKFTFDLIGKYNEVKNNCIKKNEELINNLKDFNKDFLSYKNIFKEMNDKFLKFEEFYNTSKEVIKTINEHFEENNKTNLNFENKIKELEKSILSTKKSIREISEKNGMTDITRQNNFSPNVEEDEKNSFLKNKFDLKKINIDRKNFLTKTYMKNTGNQISEDNDENIKINGLLFDGDFFGDSKILGNSSINENINDTDRIKKAKMTHYRISSGKILKHFPFISHNISNNEEIVKKMIKYSDKEKKEILKLNPNYIKKLKIDKEVNFPYNNHKYKYLEKKIDILGKVMVNNFNKIILQINFLKKNNGPSHNNDRTKTNKDLEENDDDNNITIIKSIKSKKYNSPMNDSHYSLSNLQSPDYSPVNKKLSSIKTKFNKKLKIAQSQENSIKKSYN